MSEPTPPVIPSLSRDLSSELRRREDWPQLLAEFIEARRDLPFAWGSEANDCVSFAIAWVHQMTGVEMCPATWTNEAEARAALEEAGGLIAAVTGVLGRPSQNYADAHQGDVGLVDQPGTMSGIGLMVCIGMHWAGPGVDRMLFKPLNQCRLVWRIG